MKLLVTLTVFVCSVLSINAQTLNERDAESLAELESPLIDYEILNNKVVGLIKKNQEYFIYFTNSKGAKLFESFDLFFPIDMEIDCMGNLFVVGIDSAVQLNIHDFVSKVQTLDIKTYHSSISSCKAYFENNLVRQVRSGTLVYEPIADSDYIENPMVSVIQFRSPVFQAKRDIVLSGKSASDGASIQNKRIPRRVEDEFKKPWERRERNVVRSNYGPSMQFSSSLIAFQKADSLWVFNGNSATLLIYSNKGELVSSKGTKGISRYSRMSQDHETGEIYDLEASSRTCVIKRVNEMGIAEEVGRFRKGTTRSHLKIANGYVYYLDSKGKGQSIKRVELN